ncbi:single-stranded DNA-binding protein [Candidatus Pacearchaeota archaeon]|nr:single-stranded DNA-binding protein [Candidatus Pacearchaeota archaeon]
MSTFADMKKQRKSNLTSLIKETEKITSPNVFGDTDDRFWRPELDKSGNGYAVVRFLPAPDGEDLPWARMWNHGFQGPGGWYIENSLTTLGQKDPVSEHNSQLWNSGIEANKEVARKQKRRLNYTANVYIIKDPAHPENEGQVKFYRFGKKIFDKINDLMNPEFEDESPVNPFDLWEGANFKMKIRKIEGYSNYDKSEFETPTALLDDEARLEEIWKSEFSLKELVSTDKFKTFEELKIKLDKVLGLGTENIPPAFSLPKDKTEDVPFDGGVPIQTTPKPAAESEDNDEEALGYFQKLAETA